MTPHILQILSSQRLEIIVFTLFGLLLLAFVLVVVNFKKSKYIDGDVTDSTLAVRSFLDLLQKKDTGLLVFDNHNDLLDTNDLGNTFLFSYLKVDLELVDISLSIVVNEINNQFSKKIDTTISGAQQLDLRKAESQGIGSGVDWGIQLSYQPVFSSNNLLFTLIEVQFSSNVNQQKDDNDFFTDSIDIVSTISHSRDGYLILDESLKIQSTNKRALDFLSATNEELVGFSLFEVFPELIDSEFQTILDYVSTQKTPFEFDYFIVKQSAWYNFKLQPDDFGMILFLYENTLSKVNAALSEAERTALENFSRRDISFYQIMAKSMDAMQELFPGLFCSIYTLDENAEELKFFSSGYSTFLPTVPRPIKKDFLGFDYLLKNNLRIEENNLYFDFLCELFSNNRFSTIYSQPFKSNNKRSGIFLSFLSTDVKNFKNIEMLQEKMSFFIEKLFNYHAIFRELEKLSIVSENSQKSFATINLNGKITWSNKSFNTLFLKTREELSLRSFTEIINEETTTPEAAKQINQSVNDFVNLVLDFPLRTKTGHSKQLNLTTHKIFSGDEIQLLIEINDITEQAVYEGLLLEGQEFLKKITDTVPIALFQSKLDSTGLFSFQFISKEIERFGVGITVEEMYSRPKLFLKMVHPDDFDKVLELLKEAYFSQSDWEFEFRIVVNKTVIKWIKANGVPEESVDGTQQWFGYFEDITEKKEKTQEVEEANIRFSYASKAVNEAIWELNLESNRLSWSDGLTSIFGYKKSEYPLSENLKHFIHPDDLEHYQNEFEKNVTNKNVEVFSLEYRFKKSDDSYADVLDRAFILRDKEGKSQKIIGSIKDNSDIKLFEKKKKELINETQEFERNQFSMELHDGLAQQLVALNLYLTHLENEIPADKRERVEFCKSIVIDSLNQTRTLCYNLSPPELANGLIAGLKALFDRLNRLNGITFYLNIDDKINRKTFENVDIYNVYRILQEFINNAIKHAQCTTIRCSIELTNKQKKLTIIARDNGVGFDVAKVKYGFGIQNIYKRAKLASARAKLESVIGSGSALTVTLAI
jgi:PAS domain S-box-containing protein